jgi:hypothetical protein
LEKGKTLSEKVLEAVLFFIPKANPRYDSKMHLIKEWMIEFDEDNYPYREIALDSKGFPYLQDLVKRIMDFG